MKRQPIFESQVKSRSEQPSWKLLAQAGCLTLFLLLVAALGSGRAEEKIKVAYASISPVMAGAWIAHEIGAFKKYQFDSDLVLISSGPMTVAALVSGQVHLAVGASNAVISAVHAGAPIIAVGTVTNRPAMSLFVPPSIGKPEDLKGKVVAISRIGSTSHFMTQVALDKLGLKDKVQIRPFGDTTSADAAVRSGQAWGRVTSLSPGPEFRKLLDLTEIDLPYSMDYLAVSRSYFKNSRESVKRMLMAYIEGIAVLRSDKQTSLKIFAKYWRQRTPSLEEPYEFAARSLELNPKVDPETVRTVLHWMNASEANLTKFYDNSVIEELVAEGFLKQVDKQSGGPSSLRKLSANTK